MAETFRSLDKNVATGMKTEAGKIAAIVEAWENVRSDSSPLRFFWSVYSDKTYKILASGESLEQMAESVTPENMHFGGVRVEIKGKPSFLHVLYIGAAVSIVKRGSAQMLKSAPFSAMQGGSGEISLPVGSEVTVDSLAKDIAAALGCKIEEVLV